MAHDFWVWGHRGYPACYPENTEQGFSQAIAAGVDGIETDLQCSADKEVVLFHDAMLDRVTNLHGAMGYRTWADLELARVRTPQGVLSSQGLLRLPDLFRIFGKSTVYCLELKPSPASLDTLVDRTAEIIAEWDMAHFVIISSFDASALALMAQKLPGVPRALAVAPFSREVWQAGSQQCRPQWIHLHCRDWSSWLEQGDTDTKAALWGFSLGGSSIWPQRPLPGAVFVDSPYGFSPAAGVIPC